MGTNYYLHKNICPHCGRGDEPKHIGKSSAGWCFTLHVIPDEGINDLPDWQAIWSLPGSEIRNECGKVISIGEMMEIIAARSWKKSDDLCLAQVRTGWFDYESNHAEPGPNGLVRHRIEQHGGNDRKSFTNGCIKHGAGTWDCIVGEFS